METFPQFDLFPRITRAGEFIKRVWNLGRVVEPCLSEHIREPSEQLTLEFGE